MGEIVITIGFYPVERQVTIYPNQRTVETFLDKKQFTILKEKTQHV